MMLSVYEVHMYVTAVLCLYCRLTLEEVQALLVDEAKPLRTAVVVRKELLDSSKADPPIASQPEAVCEPNVTAATAVALHGAVLFMAKTEGGCGVGSVYRSLMSAGMRRHDKKKKKRGNLLFCFPCLDTPTHHVKS